MLTTELNLERIHGDELPFTDMVGRHPRKVMEEYLDAEERQEILGSVHRLREFWYPLFGDLNDNAFLLPAGLYTQRYHPERYTKFQIAARASMMEELGWVYTKLIETTEEWYGKRAVFSPNLMYPGFHVFVGPVSNKPLNDDPELAEKYWHAKQSRYHVDAFPQSFEELESQHIESFIVPIQLPKHETQLWWLNPYVSLDEVNYLPYTEGMLGHWHGQYPHAIGDVVLEDGEARITLQFHVCIKQDSVTLFW
jgi:hypothetical protein